MPSLEAVQSMGQYKKVVGSTSQGASTSSHITPSLDTLKNFGAQQLNSQDLEKERAAKKHGKADSIEQDPISHTPIRCLIYASSKSINDKVKALASNTPISSEGVSELVEVKQEPLDFSDGFMDNFPSSSGTSNDALFNPTRGLIKEEEREAMEHPEFDPAEDRTNFATGFVPNIGYETNNAASSNTLHGSIKEEIIEDLFEYDNPAEMSVVIKEEEEEMDDTLIQYSRFNSAEELIVVPKIEEYDFDFPSGSTAYGNQVLQLPKFEEEEPDFPPGCTAEVEVDSSKMLKNLFRKGSSRKTGLTSLYCPLCDKRKIRIKRSSGAMATHLRITHGETVLSANLRLQCECGYFTQFPTHAVDHRNNCSNCSFVLLSNKDETGTRRLRSLKCFRTEINVPVSDGAIDNNATLAYICPFCDRDPVERSLRNIGWHVRTHHKRTCREAGLYFRCNCHHISRTVDNAVKHKTMCEGSTITMINAGVN